MRALIEAVRDSQEFRRFHAAFERQGVRTWSTVDERALFFSMGRDHTPGGLVVEIGSYCGGSAAFFAKGLACKGDPRGRLVCVDPLVGAPPWFPLPSSYFTLGELQRNLRALEVEDFVELRSGDSAAIAAIWPSAPIDVVLVDGDHSFQGALRDLEAWAPKLRRGGYLLFDDIDNIPEMAALDTSLAAMSSIAKLPSVEGVGVYRVIEPGWRLLDELRARLAQQGLHRPWSYEPVHSGQMRPGFRATRLWSDPALDLAYDLGYLAIAETRDYGFTPKAAKELRLVLRSVQEDRSGGSSIELSARCLPDGRIRVLVCGPEEAGECAPCLAPGGMMLAQSPGPLSDREATEVQERWKAAGLDAVGFQGGGKRLFWGVGGVGELTPQRIIDALMRDRR